MLLAPLLLALCAQDVTLPDGPAARAWAGVGVDTPGADLEAGLYAGDGWLRDPAAADPAVVYARWAAWLKSEAGAPSSDPARRAGLALFAARQRRFDDAWAHFARLGGAPEWAVAVLPQLLPGAPGDAPRAADGRLGALPDGVLLQPATPPLAAGEAPGSLRPRSAELKGLRVGEALVDFRISIEPSGVQVDLAHAGGGPATVRVLLPEPVGQAIRVEYLDWMRQDALRAPLVVALSPDDEEEHTLWGRFEARRAPLPALPRGALPRGLVLGGLYLACEPEGPLAREAAALAAALGALFELPTGVIAPGAWPAARTAEPVVARLPAGPEGGLRLVQLVTLAERRLARAER